MYPPSPLAEALASTWACSSSWRLQCPPGVEPSSGGARGHPLQGPVHNNSAPAVLHLHPNVGRRLWRGAWRWFIECDGHERLRMNLQLVRNRLCRVPEIPKPLRPRICERGQPLPLPGAEDLAPQPFGFKREAENLHGDNMKREIAFRCALRYDFRTFNV